MASKSKGTIAQQLNAAQIAVNNTLAVPEILAAVEGYGYNIARMNEGKQLYVQGLAAYNQRAVASGEQKNTTAELKRKEKEARDAYQALAQVARAIFGKERARLASLGLRGTAPTGTAAFIASGYALFDNSMSVPEISAALLEYGYTQARLESERARIEAYDLANQVQEAAKGEAQQQTREQEEALQAMNDWLAQYVKIARVALRTKPELLEKLGILARSGKTAAQRNPNRKNNSSTPPVD